MQRKINNTVICLRMGKTYKAKTSLGDFKVTTPKNPLLSQQAVTSKGIPVRDLITNLRRLFAAKFFNSSHDEDRDGYKTLRCTNITASSQER